MTPSRLRAILPFVLLAAVSCGDDPAPSQPTTDADLAVDASPDVAEDPAVDAPEDTALDVAVDVPEDTAEPDATSGPDVPQTPDYRDAELSTETEGTATVLTYNVAGLPQGISSSNPVEYIPLISPLLDSYDLVLAQEDFWYHHELLSQTHHPYISYPSREMPTYIDIGDGLNRFSVFPFGAFERVAWGMCFGSVDCASDCLATKGFSVATTLLADGAEVDVYNLHAEAGGCDGDEIAREFGILRLLDFVQVRSAGRAIIMGGDFNLHVDSDAVDSALYQRLVDGLALRDTCRELGCGDGRIDRLLVRSSDSLTLTPLTWAVPPEFVAPDGTPLSDHEPVMIEVRWSVTR